MKKTPRLSMKPKSSEDAESWVSSRNNAEPQPSAAPVKMKRVTFEVSEEEHQTIKIYATKKGMTIKELMQSLLSQELQEKQ